MRITLDKLCSYLVLFSTILMLRIDLFFVDIAHAHSNTIYYIVDVIGICLALFVVLVNNVQHISLKQPFSIPYVICMVAVFAFFFCYTMHLYKYTVGQTMTSAYGYFFVFYSIPIAYILNHKEKKQFVSTFIKIVTFFLIVRSIAWVTYNFSTFHIFANFATEYYGWNRNGIQRIPGGPLFGVAAVLVLNNIFSEKAINRKSNAVLYIALIAYSMFISNSRYQTAVLIFSLIVVYYFTRKQSTSKFGIILLVLFGIIGLILSGILDPILATFSARNVYTGYAGSTQARLMGIQHFLELFNDIGNKVGLGYIINAYTTKGYFVWTNWLNFYLADFGIFEGVIRFGFFSILIYGWLFYKLIKNAYRMIKAGSKNKPLAIAIAVYTITICILQDIYDSQSAFQVPFFVGIINYLEISNNKELECIK